jgi:hypothetical protein
MRALLASVVVLSLAVAACDSAESARVDETRAKLVGTWLQEAEAGSAKSRRVLVLGKDGNFTDRQNVVTVGSPPEQVEYGGEWSYDGTNLKRRFLRENGRQFSGGGVRFATFPLVSVSASELVVDDNIRGTKVAYRRVAEGTQP